MPWAPACSCLHVQGGWTEQLALGLEQSEPGSILPSHDAAVWRHLLLSRWGGGGTAGFGGQGPGVLIYILQCIGNLPEERIIWRQNISSVVIEKSWVRGIE